MSHQPPFPGQLKIFSGRANPELAKKICREIEDPMGLNDFQGKVEIKDFEDGEIYVRYEDNLRGRDVFIVQSTNMPNKNIIELLIMIDAASRASAGRITAVIPYYGYARQDRKARGRDPINAKLMSDLITVAGADRVLFMDLHSGQIPGFFNKTKVDHLYAKPVLINYLESLLPQNLVIVAPDVGAAKLARSYGKRLTSPIVLVDKRRPEPNKSEVFKIIGKVEGKNILMVDDIVDTAGTVVGAAQALKKEGAKEIFVACTHPVLSGDAVEKITFSPISKLFVTDTIALPEEKIPKIEVISVAPLLAQAIKAIHENDSVSRLFV